MPIKRAPCFNQGVTFAKQWTIRAGCSKEWHIVNAMEVGGDVFVEIGKQIPWVCQTVCGVGRSMAPLRRTSVLETLRKEVRGQLSPAPAGGAFDDDDPLANMLSEGVGVHTPRKKKARRSKKSEGGPEESQRVVEVSLKQQGQSLPEPVKVWARCTSRPTGNDCERLTNIWVHQDNVHQVLEALHNDARTRGVPEPEPAGGHPLAPEPAPAGGDACVSGLSYDHRDGAWLAVARGADEKRIVKKFYVSKLKTGTREPLGVEEFRGELAKSRAEAEAWLAEP